MSKFDTAQDRALQLFGELGDGIRKAVPGKAMQWVETGAALGALARADRRTDPMARRLGTVGDLQHQPVLEPRVGARSVGIIGKRRCRAVVVAGLRFAGA